MRYAGLIKNDFANGEGVCVSVFLQGCPFHCEGCHNPETWDFNGGEEIHEDTLIDNIVEALDAYGIKRNLSILGGEPLCDSNVKFTEMLIVYIKNMKPQVKIYLWTGYEMSHLLNNMTYSYILNHIDVIITGPFIQSKRDITLPLRGSTNQEVWRRNEDGILVLDKK
jgi:anaerobic ribonucleoside-triphosphate reductase activating protein